MVVIETDLVIALVFREEKHHREAIEILKRGRALTLSPYALIELDLLISSGRLRVRDVEEFYRELEGVFELYGVRIAMPTPMHMAIAARLRKRYALTYFDSLHAATAIALRDALASYDSRYSRVEELHWIHPSKLLES